MSALIFASGVSLVVLLGWGGFFYLTYDRKQSFLEILKIFSLGTLSIIPVFLFHQWLLKKVVVALVEWWPFLGGIFVSALLELFLLVLFILFFIILFSALHSLSLKAFYGFSWGENFRTIYKRIYSLAPILVFFLLFLALEAFLNLTTQESFILSLGGSTVVFAVLEEYFKYIISPFLVYKKIDSIRTAMVHALYVGLAFAFIENLLFFYVSAQSSELGAIILFRSFFTTLLHIGASGILGYFYGVSLFAESMLTNYEIEKSRYYIPKWLRGILKKTSAFKSVSITQGFFLAALFHALFNLLLYLGEVKLAALLAVLLTGSVIYILHSRTAQIQYGMIGGRVMPSADFEKLRLQISVLEHVKEIQRERIQKSLSIPSKK